MKSTSSACSTSASTKCPMRTLAITGIVTVAIISRITLIDAMRATPPSLRMSDGTRSSAITAQAPAFSAIFACSALVTSMMTPPLSISARPTFTCHSFEPLFPLPLPFTFFASISLLLSFPDPFGGCAPSNLDSLLPNHHKSGFASCQNFAGSVSNLADHEQVSSLLFCLVALDNNFVQHIDGLQILYRQFRGHRVNLSKSANLAHRFVEQHCDDSAVRKSRTALISFAQNKLPDNFAVRIVLFERELHPAGIVPAATKTSVRRIWCQCDRLSQKFLASPLYHDGPSFGVSSRCY